MEYKMFIASEYRDDWIMQLEGEGTLPVLLSFHCSGINPKHLTETT
jgi:hypothetical protein